MRKVLKEVNVLSSKVKMSIRKEVVGYLVKIRVFRLFKMVLVMERMCCMEEDGLF